MQIYDSPNHAAEAGSRKRGGGGGGAKNEKQKPPASASWVRPPVQLDHWVSYSTQRRVCPSGRRFCDIIATNPGGFFTAFILFFLGCSAAFLRSSCISSQSQSRWFWPSQFSVTPRALITSWAHITRGIFFFSRGWYRAQGKA
jgi:hypothetical protein